MPSTTAPAALSRRTGRQSVSARQSRKCGKPHVVGRPAIVNCSLTVIGSPSKRPPLFARQRGISVVGYRARSVEIPHDDGVDLLIKRLDLRNRSVDEFAGRDLSAGREPVSAPPRYGTPALPGPAAGFGLASMRHLAAVFVAILSQILAEGRTCGDGRPASLGR